MFDKECVPFAPSLIESMRSLGYSFSSAIADLIDNSISAKAKKIEIISNPGTNPNLIIFDDGCGMTQQELYEAMRYGSTSPLSERAVDDLGRFGLGLKSASLSQCRKLVVVSKKNGVLSAYSWDLDYIIHTEKWMLKGFSYEEIAMYPEIDRLFQQNQGTYICLSEFDRIKEGTSNIETTFNKNLDDMVEHLSLVFHRFLEEGLVIKVNNREIKGKDPFLSHNTATQRKKDIYIYIDHQKIALKPYILPHVSKLKSSDLDLVGGKERLRNEQGFYVYRNKRLIVWGTWFRLERKDELSKLARVRVDIPNTLDYMWSIDIKKSTAILPDIIKKNMYAAVYESVVSSEAVHTHRGRKDKKDKDIDYIWERTKIRSGYKYLINREIPQIRISLHLINYIQAPVAGYCAAFLNIAVIEKRGIVAVGADNDLRAASGDFLPEFKVRIHVMFTERIAYYAAPNAVGVYLKRNLVFDRAVYDYVGHLIHIPVPFETIDADDIRVCQQGIISHVKSFADASGVGNAFGCVGYIISALPPLADVIEMLTQHQIFNPVFGEQFLVIPAIFTHIFALESEQDF